MPAGPPLLLVLLPIIDADSLTVVAAPPALPFTLVYKRQRDRCWLELLMWSVDDNAGCCAHMAASMMAM